MNKTIFITGGSGGIGGAVAKRFQSKGWEVILPLRSFDKPEVKKLIELPGISAHLSNPENRNDMSELFKKLRDNDTRIDIMFHSAGTFLWDDGFPGPKMSIEQVKKSLEVNLTTKINTLAPLEAIYAEHLSEIEQFIVSSGAAKFTPDGPERSGPFKEEIYVGIMSDVSNLGASMLHRNTYKDVTVLEPGLINTNMAQKAFVEERIGRKVDWSTIEPPEQYALRIFPDIFFETRK